MILIAFHRGIYKFWGKLVNSYYCQFCRFVILYDIAFASIFRTSLLIASGEEASYIKTFIEEYEVSDVTTHGVAFTPTRRLEKK